MNENPLQKEAVLLGIADEVALMIWEADANKSFAWLNKSSFALTAFSSGEQPLSSWYNSMHPEDAKTCVPLFDMAFSARQKFEFKSRLQGKDGKYQWVYIKGTPRFSAQDIFLGFGGICLAISNEQTATVHLENSIAEKRLALEILRDELAEKKSEQERQTSGLESFTYIASHDLQEPLRKIQSFSKLILSKEATNLSATSKDYFSRITSAAERMQRLIDDLLSYSSANVSVISFMPTDLNIVLKEVLQNFQEVILEKEVQVKASVLPTVQAIPFQLIQLFVNIISNAIKFSKKDSPLVITIKACEVDAESIQAVKEPHAGNYWHISIADNGIGFEPGYSEKIFELFQRLHGRSEYPGTGIGLAICKKIVIHHKGYITAKAAPGAGAVFNIYLPVSN